jgi:hypothetical protein
MTRKVVDMRRTLVRVTTVGVLALVAAALATSAFATHRHAFGPQMGVRGFGPPGFGPGAGGLGGGFGLRGPLGGFLGGRPWGPGHGGPGGGGLPYADVLTPASSFLGISVSTLASDLNGGKTLAQEATAKGKTADDLIKAIVAAQKTNLDNAKAAGWVTADQETALLDRYTAAVTELVNNGPAVPPAGMTHTGPLDTAATFLGMSVSDVQAALKSGKTLADLASSKGKSVSDLVTALIAPAKKNLDAAVTSGKLTQAQETALLNNLTTHVTNLVNGTKPTRAQMSSVRQTIATFAARRAFATAHH